MNLKEKCELLAEAGTLLLKWGANASRVERVVNRFSVWMGVDSIDLFISQHSMVVTVKEAGDIFTIVKRVPTHGVNMTIVSGVSRLSWRLNDEHAADYFKSELKRLSGLKPYPAWLLVPFVGLACGSFAVLSGGDMAVFAAVSVAAACGMAARRLLHHKGFNPLIVFVSASFISSLVASFAVMLSIGNSPKAVLAASVLYLIPGVYMINSIQDIVSGHIIIGVARGMISALFTLYIAIGILAAMLVTGVHL